MGRGEETLPVSPTEVLDAKNHQARNVADVDVSVIGLGYSRPD